MTMDFLQDVNGRRIGYIDRGSVQDAAHNMNGHRLGFYIKRSNQTTDVNGHRIGFGDHLARLIWDDWGRSR